MNRKDFELIARTMKTAKPRPDMTGAWSGPVIDIAREAAWLDCCYGLAAQVSDTTGRARFLKACGVSNAAS